VFSHLFLHGIYYLVVTSRQYCSLLFHDISVYLAVYSFCPIRYIISYGILQAKAQSSSKHIFSRAKLTIPAFQHFFWSRSFIPQGISLTTYSVWLSSGSVVCWPVVLLIIDKVVPCVSLTTSWCQCSPSFCSSSPPASICSPSTLRSCPTEKKFSKC
jgi:hypothetical protein